MIRLEGPVHSVALANLDADCGDELVALRPLAPNHESVLFEVDPSAGTALPARFWGRRPSLINLIAVPAPNGRDRRIFAHTGDLEIAELAPSSSGPPRQ